MSSNIDWQTWRAEFPGLANSTYLNTVSLGQLSRSSRQAVNDFMDLWTQLGARAWYKHWLGAVDDTRSEFARLIGADVEEIAIMPNVSSALAAISSSLQHDKRSGVISTALDFPTLTHHWLARSRQGVETHILPSADGISIPLETYQDAVNAETSLIATSRVFFTTGYLQDVKALAEITHAAGAYCLIDDYQATGQVPIDVHATGVDFLISGGLKWLIGGPGIAYLYVRRELIEKLEPTITGWFSQKRQFDFDPLHLEYREDARRFEGGTPSVAAVYAACAGLQIINEIGSQNLRQRTAVLTADLVERLRASGYQLRIPAQAERQAGITLVVTEEAARVTTELAERNIIVDYRPGVVRIAPYFYNTVEENELVVEALREVLPL